MFVFSFYFRATPPSVAWAQRNHCIFLTICLEDCKNPKIVLEKDQLVFDGVGGTEKKHHQVTIPFYKEIDVEVRYFFSIQNEVIFNFPGFPVCSSPINLIYVGIQYQTILLI